MNTHLIIHNVEAIISSVSLAFVIIFLMINNPKKLVNITLALMCLSCIVFLTSHIIGVSQSDPEISRQILMWNISIIFICLFNFHAVMIVLKQGKEKFFIGFIYLVAIILTVLYIAYPETFLSISEPKMYFPNYYVAGEYHWVMRVIFNLMIPIYFVYRLIHAFKNAENQIEKNRILYFALSLGLGWGIGSLPIPLIFNIQIDPALGLLFPIIFAIPFTYAVVRYELLDIRIIAKKAFGYGVAVAGLGGILTVLNASDQLVTKTYPGFPAWIIPLVTSVFAVAIAVIVSKKLREGDILKYEFITTATHKFRTPLTHIKWASENLSKMQLPEEVSTQIDYIQNANSKLVELTNVLMNVSESDNNNFDYRMERVDVSEMAKEIIDNSEKQAAIKHVHIQANLIPGLFVSCDTARIKFIIQTFIENAIHYTPSDGTVSVSTIREDDKVIFAVKDSGIGITKEESSLLFSKFYRGNEARLADTEGMGIGLYICKDIIARHNGKIWAESEGRDKGSTFRFSLSAASEV